MYAGKQLRYGLLFFCDIDLRLTMHRRHRWVSEYKDLVGLAALVPDLILDIGEGGLQRVTGEVCFIHLMVEDY